MASRVVALKNAVRSGDKDLVVKLLDQGVDPNQFGSSSDNASSPLMVACLNGHLDLIRLLISRGAKVNLKNGRHETALFKVISSNITKQRVMLEVEHVLLQHKAKVHFGNHYEGSAMMNACRRGNAELVRLLLPYDSWDDKDYTHKVFSEAVENGHAKVVELFLACEHIEIAQAELVNSLHKACDRYHDNSETVRIILDKYPELVDSTIDEQDGYTPLMKAGDNIDIVKMLLVHGAKIDYQNKLEHTDSSDGNEGLTALMIAAERGWLKAVELLLEEGAVVDLTDSMGRTALIIACEKGQTDSSKLLVEKKANINHVDCRGGYALLYAVKYAVSDRVSNALLRQFEKIALLAKKMLGTEGDTIKIIELLLERGAKADVVADDEETAEKVMLTHAPSLLVSLKVL